MENVEFCRKADQLKPVLYKEEIDFPGSEKILKEGEEIIFDLGNHYVGHVDIDFGTVGRHPDAPLYFEIQFAEIKEELSYDSSSYHGWLSKSWIQQEYIHLDNLPGSISLPRRYAFRYVRIRVLSTSPNYDVYIKGLRVHSETSADDKKVKRYSWSEKDRLLDDISIRTLRSCMQEVFEDGPKRDRRLWLGDLRLQALANYETFQNDDLVKRCLYLFAGHPLEEGRLSSNIFLYLEEEADDQPMFDYALFFIDTLWDYYSHTGDKETLEELYPTAYRQFVLSSSCIDENGSVDEAKAGRVFVDWNFELDRNVSALGIYIYALKDLLKMARELNKDTKAIEDEIARRSLDALKLYDEREGFFVSGEKKQISWMSQIWMILSGVIDEEKGNAVLERLSKRKNAVGMNSPYAYHHYIQVLIDLGRKEEAYQKMHEYWDGMIERGSSTFWELYDPKDPVASPYGGLVVHSFCHAWSCTPAYFLRKYFKDKEIRD
ncbi:MAG: hypothetical protein IIZ33_09130 [Erysipelotrichaceae bacterium]|nr:hypothetical protein [Erysipelotrichaceae bacterium]